MDQIIDHTKTTKDNRDRKKGIQHRIEPFLDCVHRKLSKSKKYK